VPDEPFRARAPAVPLVVEAIDPPPKVMTEKSGLRVEVFPRPFVPIMHVRLVVDRGAIDLGDPGGLKTEEVDQLFRRLGDETTYEEISAHLTEAGGTWNKGFTRDAFWVDVKVPRTGLAAALEAISRGFVHAWLSPAEYELRSREWKNIAVSASLGQENAERLILFGDKHAYGYAGEGSVLMPREEAQAVHDQLFQPLHSRLVVVGDADPAEVAKAVEKELGSWGAKTARRIARRALPPPDMKGARLAVVSGAPEDFRYGAVFARGPAPDSADLDAFRVAVEVIGGVVSSRLYEELRRDGDAFTSHGETHVARTATWAEIGTSYARGRTVAGVEKTLKVIEALRAGTVSEEDVATAKEALAGALRADLATDQGAAKRYGDPDATYAYVRAFPGRIAKVRGIDVVKVAKKYLAPDALHVLLIGRANQIDPAPLGLGAPLALAPKP
jgi:predicted Zn-dependent peptidase